MFQGRTAWFSSSVPEEVKAIWSGHAGLQCDLQTADYIFSDDSSARDTIGFYKTKEYLDFQLTIFKSEWIVDAVHSRSLCEHPLSDYILVEPDIYILAELKGFAKNHSSKARQTRKDKDLEDCTTSRVCALNDVQVCIESRTATDFGKVNTSGRKISNHQREANQQDNAQGLRQQSSPTHSLNSESQASAGSGNVELHTTNDQNYDKLDCHHSSPKQLGSKKMRRDGSNAPSSSKENDDPHEVAASVKSLDDTRSEVDITIGAFHSSMCDGFVEIDELELPDTALMDFIPGKNGCKVRCKMTT